ncbi:MAG: acetylxylan esterase [Cyclobacteriaceae bacterium]|nr:acetylxylan esterase [Cyclobacteriaceae bacterium HetDA_MAG_MS6]
MLSIRFPLVTYCFALALVIACSAPQDENRVISNESEVPAYILPPLAKSVSEWESSRGSILRNFETYIYGKVPEGDYEIAYQTVKERKAVLNGKANLKEVEVSVSTANGKLSIPVLLLTPTNLEGSYPTILGLNFYGNHSIHLDTAISLSSSWMRPKQGYGIVDFQATDSSRGVRSYRWSIDKILKAGFALATFYYGDIDPDYHDEFQNGIHPLFYSHSKNGPDPNEWGAIAAWAWGAQRVMDYLQVEELVDSKRIALFGHSRLGKTSLWAGAQDPRFAAVISNNSGCGGAAIFRRTFGETSQAINKSFPHWFCENFKQFNRNEANLPVDQHQLVALIAPRPVYIASASADLWADPRGEFLAAKEASKVYALYGKPNLANALMPDINQPLMTYLGYHLRDGKHDVTPYDWDQYLKFLTMHFNDKD